MGKLRYCNLEILDFEVAHPIEVAYNLGFTLALDLVGVSKAL